MALAYKPTNQKQVKADYNLQPIKKFPWSRVISGGAGITNDNFRSQSIFILTGIAIACQTDGSAFGRFAAATVTLNNEQIAAYTVVCGAGNPKSGFCFFHIPDWEILPTHLISTTLNNSVQQLSSVTLIGYYV